MQEKTRRIGGIDVLEEIRCTINDLRTHARRDWLRAKNGGIRTVPKHLENEASSTRKLWLLKEELELTESYEQVHQLRKRLALAEFFNTYTAAQADSWMRNREEIKKRVSHSPLKCV
jgi:hypothetical protein